MGNTFTYINDSLILDAPSGLYSFVIYNSNLRARDFHNIYCGFVLYEVERENGRYNILFKYKPEPDYEDEIGYFDNILVFDHYNYKQFEEDIGVDFILDNSNEINFSKDSEQYINPVYEREYVAIDGLMVRDAVNNNNMSELEPENVNVNNPNEIIMETVNEDACRRKIVYPPESENMILSGYQYLLLKVALGYKERSKVNNLVGMKIEENRNIPEDLLNDSRNLYIVDKEDL